MDVAEGGHRGDDPPVAQHGVHLRLHRGMSQPESRGVEIGDGNVDQSQTVVTVTPAHDIRLARADRTGPVVKNQNGRITGHVAL